MVIERASPNDLTELASETATAPMQIAAVLRLRSPIPAGAVEEELRKRLPAVPRLRQRLQPAPIGLGRPVWVDDPDFDLIRHVHQQASPDAATEATVLRAAADAAVAHLPRDRPLWAALLITDPAGACHALVLVLHHVVADGMGGLAALAGLADPAAIRTLTPFPAAAPSNGELRQDAIARLFRRVGGIASGIRTVRAGTAELRFGGPARHVAGRAPRTTLNRPIGHRRRLATARVDLSDAASAAHRYGATINDVLLTAVAGALGAVLRARGESADHFVISVPVSARRTTTTAKLGNQVGVIPVAVPAGGSPRERLAGIAGCTRVEGHTTGRGSSAAVLGLAFRALARIGVFGWFINHQRLVNTFVSNLRGPEHPLRFAGSEISDIVAISPIAGNVTVAFTAISYAGTLTVTVIGDADTCPDIDLIASALQDQLTDCTRGSQVPDTMAQRHRSPERAPARLADIPAGSDRSRVPSRGFQL